MSSLGPAARHASGCLHRDGSWRRPAGLTGSREARARTHVLFGGRTKHRFSPNWRVELELLPTQESPASLLISLTQAVLESAVSSGGWPSSDAETLCIQSVFGHAPPRSLVTSGAAAPAPSATSTHASVKEPPLALPALRAARPRLRCTLAPALARSAVLPNGCRELAVSKEHAASRSLLLISKEIFFVSVLRNEKCVHSHDSRSPDLPVKFSSRSEWPPRRHDSFCNSGRSLAAPDVHGALYGAGGVGGATASPGNARG